MTCYIVPAIFFLLPSLTNPGAFEKVNVEQLPYTESVLKTSEEEPFKRFRKYWKVTSHQTCKKEHGPGYCASEILITPESIFARCFHLPLR